MTETMELDAAVVADRLDGAQLQASIDGLLAMAAALDPLLASETDVESAREIGRTQARMRAMAGTLVGQQIDLIANEARITAGHINDATAFAQDVIAKIEGWKKKAQKLARLVQFFGSVLTGDAKLILKEAIALKKELDAG
jgi:hypothetical protein